MKNHGSGNKESSKERNETPGQTKKKGSAHIYGFGRACSPQSLGNRWGLPASPAIPRASGSGVGLDKTTMVLSHMMGWSQGQIRAKWIAKILSHFGTSYEVWRNGDTGLSAHLLSQGQGLSSLGLQKRACCPPLPLPRIWQAQAHVPT